MKRQLLILSTLTVILVCVPESATAGEGFGGKFGHGGGFKHGRGISHSRGIRHTGGFGHGFGGGVFVDAGTDFAELYRELLDNVPYFALHPPVYYSYPVPRTYGYSPFAYPGCVMTPEIVGEPQPLTILNPHVPNSPQKQAEKTSDRTAAVKTQPEPLTIINPFVTSSRAVAQSH